MTDREPGAPDDVLPVDETDGDALPDEPFADEGDDQDDEGFDESGEIDDSAAAAGPARLGARTARGDEPRRAATAGPGAAERAVHLDDRASAIFVLAIVATFVGVLLFGLLVGKAGFFTPLPTPSPIPTEPPLPSESPSLAPSESPAGSPSGSPSASPGASGSGAPSGSPSASPSGSAKPSPSGSAKPSPSPSGSTKPSASPSGSPSASPAP